MRIAIAGGPLTGKTTLAEELSFETGWPLFHTDDLIDLGWSEASAAAAAWFNQTGPLIVEGVAVPRALRKWLDAHPGEVPVDRIVWMGKPYKSLNDGQARMAKGCRTVFEEIEPILEELCVEVYDGHGVSRVQLEDLL